MGDAEGEGDYDNVVDGSVIQKPADELTNPGDGSPLSDDDGTGTVVLDRCVPWETALLHALRPLNDVGRDLACEIQ